MMQSRIAAPEPTDKAAGVAAAARDPDVGEVDRIAGLEDPVLRNLRITLCYSKLSAVLARRLPAAANWCTFATWASRQAGRTIRREDLERATGQVVDRWLGQGAGDDIARAVRALGAVAPVAEVRRTVRDALLSGPALARAADAVARGN